MTASHGITGTHFSEYTVADGATLANSSTVTILSTNATDLYKLLFSPPEEVFFEVLVSVVKAGIGAGGYADVYRLLGSLQNDSTKFTTTIVTQVFHWDIPIASSTYSNYVSGITVDISGGNVRVRVTGVSNASEARATAWMTLRCV